MECSKTIEKINETRGWFYERIDKIGQILSIVTKVNRESHNFLVSGMKQKYHYRQYRHQGMIKEY